MAEAQNNEIVINDTQLEEIRKTVSEANELFRRVGILESEKINMLGAINQLNMVKKEFMQKIGGEYGLDPKKLELYTIDLETGKVLEGDQFGPPPGSQGENG
tara:strand:- start:1309 stop:1614 length:306 start_codon:yes stop_codon:yes gene_type:complete